MSTGRGIGPFEGMQDAVTGEITVFCDAGSHPRWKRTFSRRGDDPWTPDPFEHVGDRVRTPRRGGGLEYINAAGEVVRFWDNGHGIADAEGTQRMLGQVNRARAVADLDDDAPLPLGRRYSIRCPECGDTIRRAEPKLTRHLNLLWAQGICEISLTGLRGLDRLV